MTWTQFMDMYSGGGQKLDWPYIYIEAPEEEAIGVFVSRFGRNPHRVTCTCCGDDYSVSEDESLERATAYNRNCEWDKATKKYVEAQDAMHGRYGAHYQTLDEYLRTSGVLVIRADDIAPTERSAVPQPEGYVWVEP